MLFEHLLDLLGVVHCRRVDLEAVPLDFANTLAGVGLLEGGYVSLSQFSREK